MTSDDLKIYCLGVLVIVVLSAGVATCVYAVGEWLVGRKKKDD